MSARTRSRGVPVHPKGIPSVRFAPLSFTLLPLLLITACGTRAPATDPEILSSDLESEVYVLASDRMEGRRAGTEGAERAARYLVGEFRRCGLEPMGDDGGYGQKFDFVSGVELGSHNDLEASDGGRTFDVGTDWRPLSFSENGEGGYRVIFAGYGISEPDEGWDDYAGINVEGMAVVLLPYGPPAEGGGMRFPSRHALRNKAFNAREHGAAAVLFAPHPALDPADYLEPLRYETSPSSAGIMAATITASTADYLLGGDGRLATLQGALDTGGLPSPAAAQRGIRLRVQVEQVHATGTNVVGAVARAPEDAPWVIIGAHYDHLGRGGEGSLDPTSTEIHNGADDNASGTAGVLELAQYFAANPPQHRNVLFAAFTAEEIGLLGSAYLAAHLPERMGRVEAMINMDMIGRLNPENALTISGTGTSAGWDALLDRLNGEDGFHFELSRVPDGYGPSDQASFYARQIPVLHFFTGTHEDYHRPTDDPETLNYDGEQRVVRFVRALVEEIDGLSSPLAYTAVSQPQSEEGGRAQLTVYTGVVPDFAWQGKGFRISGVSEASPAEMAGLEGGDIILRMGSRTINDIYDYQYALEEGSPGQRIEMEIRRGEETFTVQIVLGNRRKR